MKKKILVMLLSLFLFPLSLAYADGIEYDRAVSFDRLPARARTFLQTYYPQAVWFMGKKEVDGFKVEYQVSFRDGVEVEFKRNGKLKKVRNRNGVVPASLVPAPIAEFLQANFPASGGIYQMERDRREIEVKMRNGLECTFSARSYLPMSMDM